MTCEHHNTQTSCPHCQVLNLEARVSQLQLALELLLEAHGEPGGMQTLLIGAPPDGIDLLQRKVQLVRRLHRYKDFMLEGEGVHTCHANCINVGCLLMTALRLLEDGA